MSGKSKRDLSGNTYGYLTVLRRSSDKGNGKKPVIKYTCRCVCGKVFDVKSDSLLSGHTVSCGCQKIKHGYANKERLYNIWGCMRQRCNNPRNPSYPHYGGKGVTICEEWNDYQEFRNWALANGYDDTLSIDRINPDGNYCPSNCRWADDKTQMNNQTRNHYIEYEGQRYTMAQLADRFHLSYAAMQHRIERGWDMERIINQEQRRW
ncbi:MAG: hypothetical protein IJH07_05565 [Ruminococcus sp.]|nr:hypothetical protein [Ruminococcus sp.]